MESQTRQELIKAAITFLQNPKLIDSPLKDKLKFLRDKGLNEIEVDEALNLALISRQQKQNGKWNFLLVLGLCVGGYKIYQAYRESQQAHLAKVEKEAVVEDEETKEPKASWSDILEMMTELKHLMHEHKTELKYLIDKQKSEITSLKTVLLSQNQLSPPPIIPEWQMKRNKDNDKEE